MSALVYQAINSVSAELAEIGIPKRRRNEDRDYAYRGIEDVLIALAPLLAKHRLCVLPRVITRHTASFGAGSEQVVTVLRVAFDLVSAMDGSRHVIESFGEALDDSDKGTAKAMSAAYKCAMLQAFCIPVPQEDADATSPSLSRIVAQPEPAGGWESWSIEVIDIAKSCDSADAIDLLCARRRSLLAALQRSRPDLYSKVGEAIAQKLADLKRPAPTPAPRRRKQKMDTLDVATAEAA